MSDILRELGVELLWFDSLGAKSSSIYVETSSGGIVIDPGAAVMQPSYPLPPIEKLALREKAIRKIEEYCWNSKTIIVTHYHYDHHTPPSDVELRNPKAMYLNGKLLVLKNPNTYINKSQWERSRLFLLEILSLAGEEISNYLEDPEETSFEDPVQELTYALSKDFGNYAPRRMELLDKGRKWFMSLAAGFWSSRPWIRDNITLSDSTKIVWGEGKVFKLGDTRVEILGPWFHGIEYDRTGWVTPILIVKCGRRILYTSDLMGPQIEDYAHRIADLKPEAIIADGPPTYLFPYMLNKVNMNRAVENMVYIIENAKPQLIIYDHHLLRERRWRKRVIKVFEVAGKTGVTVMTAAEYMGSKPLINTI